MRWERENVLQKGWRELPGPLVGTFALMVWYQYRATPFPTDINSFPTDIRCPKRPRKVPEILHAVAHLILGHDLHTREFCTLMLRLWEDYLGLDRLALRRVGAKQRPRRVWFAPQHALPTVPKYLRQLPRRARVDWCDYTRPVGEEAA